MSAERSGSFSDKLKVFLKKEPWLSAVILGAVIYSLFFSVVSLLRYEAFSYSDYDSAIFIHEAWKILHGTSTISLLDGAPIWGNAVEAISFVTAPLYGLAGFNPKSLFILQAVLLGFTAVPLFLIGRQKIPQKFAAALAFSYLLNPSVWFANLYEYNPLSLTTFTLMMAFYFFQTYRMGWFLTFIVLSMINRLDLGVVTGMFAVYAFVRRRPWNWVLAPGLISAGWVALGVFYFIPTFKHLFGYYEIYYPQFGKGFVNIVINIITHPQLLLNSLITPQNGKYFLEVLFPVAFLSLGGLKEFLICGLSLLQHLISTRGNEHTIFFHYTSTVTPFVYISAVWGIARCLRLPKASSLLWILPVACTIVANFSYGPISTHKYYIEQVVKDEMDDYKKELLIKIPKDASVVSTFEFSPMLAGRYYYYTFHYIYSGLYHTGAPYPVPENIDYALINFVDPRMIGFHREQSDLNTRHFLEDNRYGVVDMLSNVVLFKKGYRGDLWLYRIGPSVPSSGSMIEVGQQIEMRTFETHLLNGSHRILDFVFHWVPREASKTIWMDLSIQDKQKKEVFYDVRPLCYDIYPSKRWQKGEEILDHYRMLLPKSIKPGAYKLSLEFFTGEGMKRVKARRLDASAAAPFENEVFLLNLDILPDGNAAIRTK
jgi:uncharacterized membrane protein